MTNKTKKELEKELLVARRKLTNLPLDCSDRQWNKRTKVVEDLELKLANK